MPSIEAQKVATCTTIIDPAGLYRLTSFIHMTGYSRASWFIMINDGRAPKPAVKPSRRLSLWRGADILIWLADPTTYKDRAASGQPGYGSLAQFVAR